jgi:superfamily II DNA or RNA helicase
VSGLLRSLDLADRYRSDLDDVVRQFYVPCLSVAVRYDRAVGFFTSRALELVTRGLDTFEHSGGYIRLVASPYFTQNDIAEINTGYEYRDVIARAISRELDPETDRTWEEVAALGLLGRLIARGSLDVKIAIVHDFQGLALYHEKIGVFLDEYDDIVTFTGSLNETGSAFLRNFESFEVFRSWKEHDRLRAERLRQDFDRLWSGTTPRLEVIDFPNVARERFAEFARLAADAEHKEPEDGNVIVRSPETFQSGDGWCRLPPDIKLRDYQKDAVEKWLAANGRGIFRMATGTGKTITALAALDQVGRQLRSRSMPLVTVVVVPLLDLVEQWTDELKKFGVMPIRCRDISVTWESQARQAMAALGARGARAVTLVTTNATFGGEVFQQVLQSVEVPLMVIADEVHHLGAEHLRSTLPERARFRLALSATPERWFDPVGTDALLGYFGDILIDLGLSEAIRLGALTPYRYEPVLVPLQDQEATFYAELTRKIGATLGGADPDTVAGGEGALEQLLRRRSQVLGHAQGKLPALETELGTRRNSWFQLVYCAEGNRPAEGGAVGENQVDAALDLIGNYMRLSVHPFTAREDRRERQQLLRFFSTGRDLRVLVSMRCLDEGVDLPEARIAYMLASSSNPRQFIQRRGRILRRAEGKDRAEIIDFVAVPPQDPDLFNTERKLFRREVARCLEFARFSQNYGEALAKLRPLRDYYGLMDV